MKYLTLVLCIALSVVSFAQEDNDNDLPIIDIEFSNIVVLQLDPVSDTVVDRWETVNSCRYWLEDNSIHYEERGESNHVIQSWKYEILSYSFDSNSDTFEVLNEEGRTVNVVVWRDGTMVALQGKDFTFLISGAN